MISISEATLSHSPGRSISPYDYSLLFRFIDNIICIVMSYVYSLVFELDNASGFFSPMFVTLNFLIAFNLIGHFGRLYAVRDIFDDVRTVRRFVILSLTVLAFLLFVGAGIKVTSSYSRLWFFSWSISFILLGASARFALIAWVERRLQDGSALRRALLVSLRGNSGLRDLPTITENRTRCVGYIEVDSLYETAPIEAIARRLGTDMIILEVPWSEFDAAMTAISGGFWASIQDVYVVPVASSLAEKGFRSLSVERHGKHLFFKTQSRPISGWQDRIKRFEDIVIALTAILVCAPVMILAAAAIRLTSRGPILFRQTRQGFGGETFEVYKFRSMYASSTDAHAARQTSRNDPRVTPVGAFLRRTSLDELPQLFNVLRGDMSIVGPRPHALRTSVEGRALSEVVEKYASRFRVKPGITGWAQVNGWRGELDREEKILKRVEYDQYYIENWSIIFDIIIIVKTIKVIISDKFAY